MPKLLHAIGLGDRYEIYARLLPAMVVVLPVTTLAIGMDLHSGHWIRAAGIGSGLEVVLAVLLSKLGHALGSRVEKKCQNKWGGMPTTQWLIPEDKNHSEQQKQIWRRAIATISGLNFDTLLATGDIAELRKALDDGILMVRNKIRADNRAMLLRQHNIYYGFAKNLAGLAWIATALSFLCLGFSTCAALKDAAPPPAANVGNLIRRRRSGCGVTRRSVRVSLCRALRRNFSNHCNDNRKCKKKCD